jgi:hypothetical protein
VAYDEEVDPAAGADGRAGISDRGGGDRSGGHRSTEQALNGEKRVKRGQGEGEAEQGRPFGELWPVADGRRGRAAEIDHRTGVCPQQSRYARPPQSPKPATRTLSHHLFSIDMADEAFLLSSAALAGSSSGLASARAVGYTTQPKQTSRVVVLNPAVGLTVYDVSRTPPTRAMQSSIQLASSTPR